MLEERLRTLGLLVVVGFRGFRGFRGLGGLGLRV